MGIGRVQARADLAAIRAVTTRAQMRDEVAAAVGVLQDWLAKRDAQDAQAVSDFATSKPGQFSTFVAALPDIVPDQTP